MYCLSSVGIDIQLVQRNYGGLNRVIASAGLGHGRFGVNRTLVPGPPSVTVTTGGVWLNLFDDVRIRVSRYR